MNSPRFSIALAMVTPAKVMVPSFTIVPPPLMVPPSTVSPPLASTVSGPSTDTVRTPATSVRVPVPPPIVSAFTPTCASSVTVYVPSSVIATESPAPGTMPVLQLAPLFQLPPAGLVHATRLEPGVRMLNAELVAPCSPLAEATNV
jgi:hypothetical protein